MSLNACFFVFCLLVVVDVALTIQGTFRMRLESPTPAYVRVCLKEWQHNIVHNGKCSLGQYNGTLNPEIKKEIEIPFKGIWPGNVSIVVDAFNGKLERVGGMAWRGRVAGGDDWTPPLLNGIEISYRFECQESFYGPQCNVMCVDRDSSFGHYTCGSQGEKVCMKGWEGINCDKPICENGCVNGTCIAPNVCACKNGFTGLTCSKCIPNENCVHGTCANNKPFTCACSAGWTGPFCDEDRHYCSHHSPCKNGGSCTNGRLSRRQRRGVEYTCTCPAGFGGANCEVELVDKICRNGHLCRNGGECMMPGRNGSANMCRCTYGFVGPNCQYDLEKLELGTNPCYNNPCENGATCSWYGGNAVCKCSSSCHYGPFCSIVDRECLVKELKLASPSRSYGQVENIQISNDSKGRLLLLGFLSLTLSFIGLSMGILALCRKALQVPTFPFANSTRPNPTIYKISVRDDSNKDAPPPYCPPDMMPTLQVSPALIGRVKYVERTGTVIANNISVPSLGSMRDPLVSTESSTEKSSEKV